MFCLSYNALRIHGIGRYSFFFFLSLYVFPPKGAIGYEAAVGTLFFFLLESIRLSPEGSQVGTLYLQYIYHIYNAYQSFCTSQPLLHMPCVHTLTHALYVVCSIW